MFSQAIDQLSSSLNRPSFFLSTQYSWDALLWCLFSAAYTVLNKRILATFSFPLTIATIQLCVTSLCGIIMWMTVRTHAFARLRRHHVLPLTKTAVFNAAGIAFLQVALTRSPVSWTILWKTAQPSFSSYFDGLSSPAAYLSWFGILWSMCFAGVRVPWIGFGLTMLHNLALVGRHQASRKLSWYRFGGAPNLFMVMTMLSFLILAPIALLVEGKALTNDSDDVKAICARLSDDTKTVRLLIMSGILFWLTNEFAIKAQDKENPKGSTVADVSRRCLSVIVAAIYLHEDIPSVWGFGPALGGLALYNLNKTSKPKGRSRADSEASIWSLTADESLRTLETIVAHKRHPWHPTAA
jgi:solute carrier family 35 protein E1